MKITNLINKLPWHPTKKWGTRTVSKIKKIIVHQELGEAEIENVNNYHIKKNHISADGCPHFCYHYGIRKDGEVVQANELTHVTWHCANQNTVSVGIMLVGNFNGTGYDLGTSEPTKEQIKSLEELVKYLQDQLKLTNQDIYGHYHFGKPACPGHTLQKWVEAKRANVVTSQPEVVKSITEIQKRLAKLGYPVGKADGVMGIKTLAGIRAFQGDHGLTVDGVVGPMTWKKLLEVS